MTMSIANRRTRMQIQTCHLPFVIALGIHFRCTAGLVACIAVDEARKACTTFAREEHMRRWFMRDAAVFATAIACTLTLVSTHVGAQAQTRPANKAAWTPPRTSDGHPDFQGTYDVATITPLERPAGLGNRLTLTREEADALEKVEAQRDAEDRLPSDPNRSAPPVG